MKFYSEKTQKLYNSIEELKNAEKELAKQEEEEKAKRDARAKRAKEVEDAYKHYKDLLDAFIKDYGSYHMSINDSNSIFDLFFNHWPF